MKKSLCKTGIMGLAIATALGLSSLGSCARQPELTQTTTPASEESQGPASSASTSSGEPSSKPSDNATAASASPAKTTPVVSQAPPTMAVKPPASEVVPADAKSAAATLTDAPLPLMVQSYSGDELFAVGGGGCGMSLWLAEGTYSDSSILFSGMGAGPQLWMKLDGQWATFERIEGSGTQFYGQFAQQRFRNLSGDIEVMTETELGADGEIESVAIDRGRVVVTQDGVSQEIAVKGDAGC